MNKKKSKYTQAQLAEYEMVWGWASRTRDRITDRDLIKAMTALQAWIDRKIYGDTLPERLDYIMTKKDITGAQLGKMCGVSGSAINRIRCGGTARSDTITKIAKALGVSIAWLLGEGGKYEE